MGVARRSQLGGCGHGHLHAGQLAQHHERACHVVAIPHVGELEALDRAEPLAQREQVRDGLARVVIGGEHVHHGHRRVLRQLLHRPVRARADGDHMHEPGEHERGVAHRFASRELHLALAQHERVAAELVHADLEGHAGPRGRPLEDQGHAASGQRAGREAIALELGRAVEQGSELGARKLRACEEVAWHGRGMVGTGCGC
jgi:hypothetical protein